jgi:hypothetical protein
MDFDYFIFPRLCQLFPSSTRVHKTFAAWRKIRFFLKEIVRPGWPLFAAYLLIGAPPAIRWFRERSAVRFPHALILVAGVFALAGCFMPSRYQDQHFFVVVPLFALGIAFGFCGANPRELRLRTMLLALFAICGTAKDVYVSRQTAGPDAYDWLRDIATPSEWFPIRAHALALRMRSVVPEGRVLTLAPSWPLEAGLKIYPEFATAPFAWRAARLLHAERRARFKLIGPAELEQFLAADPPAAVLTGVEDEELEKPLIAYAKQHGYRPVTLGKGQVVWTP